MVNKQGKRADDYLEDNPQLMALYEGYGEGIWAAIESSNTPETERLIKGTISSAPVLLMQTHSIYSQV